MELESITVLGPTASGKTKRAVSLAKYLNGEIISADSRQVYKDMSIGTGKDLDEYFDIPYHLIDVCEAGEKYNLHRYLKDFHRAYNDIIGRKSLPIICGGSGMYLEQALNGINMPNVPPNEALREELEQLDIDDLTRKLQELKSLHNITDTDTKKRAIRALEIAYYYKENPNDYILSQKDYVTPLRSLIIGLDIPREARRELITIRLRERIEKGMLEEVRMLMEKGIAAEDLIYYGLEYKFITLHLIGELSFEEMFSRLEIAIHQFAKRQMTWFRGMERRGFRINWLPYNLSEKDFIDSVVSLM